MHELITTRRGEVIVLHYIYIFLCFYLVFRMWNLMNYPPAFFFKDK